MNLGPCLLKLVLQSLIVIVGYVDKFFEVQVLSFQLLVTHFKTPILCLYLYPVIDLLFVTG